MKLTKMNGAGNDFIIINNLAEHLPLDVFPELAIKLCDRKTGLGSESVPVDMCHIGADSGESPVRIGADGMMVVDEADGICGENADECVTGSKADFKMRFYNSDGSVGEMCGNGARCICRFGYENGLSGEKQAVETIAGIVTGERIDGVIYKIKLNSPGRLDTDVTIDVDGTEYKCAYVELGNPGIPHCVIEYPGLKNADEDELRELGRKIRYNEAFYKGANVNFYETGDNAGGQVDIFERTYERGVEDFTLACGTGTGSLVVALTAKGIVDGRDVHVQMRGGELVIDWDGTDLYLTGPTEVEFETEYF